MSVWYPYQKCSLKAYLNIIAGIHGLCGELTILISHKSISPLNSLRRYSWGLFLINSYLRNLICHAEYKVR